MKKISFTVLLVFINALLILFLALSFIPSAKRNRPESKQTALLNANHISSIKSIKIEGFEHGERQYVVLSKHGSVWEGYDSLTGSRWPADLQAVEKCIENAASIVNVRTVASKSSSWKSFGVDDESASKISVFSEDGSVLTSLCFGKSDGLTRRISFRTSRDETVYETDYSLSPYLTASSSFWADPFIYPQSLTGRSRKDSESFLRHGLLTEMNAEDLDFLWQGTKEFENGSEIRLKIYPLEENFLVVPEFRAGEDFTEEEKKSLEEMNYKYTVSKWTYDAFVQEFDGK
ncbi:MAG TPA: hypothetical protein DEO40_07685 [Treponema sp.]|jgi:hypothetical protein|nr:hypothetical protein [Treponema sp.]HBB42620.1 hypothetical protein [Treponema sp.]HCA20541.1 hypothetical protein [Treponema sp.]